jgi:hypothetical protein
MRLTTQLAITIGLALIAILAVNRYALGFENVYPENFFMPDRKPQVRAFVQRHKPVPKRIITKAVIVPEKVKPSPRCLPYITAIGDSAKSEAAARLEAQKTWKAMVAFNAGQKFMSIDIADNVEYLCGPSNVPRFGGLVEGTASKWLPINDYTCQISAQPCLLPVKRETK